MNRAVIVSVGMACAWLARPARAEGVRPHVRSTRSAAAPAQAPSPSPQPTDAAPGRFGAGPADPATEHDAIPAEGRPRDRMPWIDVGAALGLGVRDFRYNDRVSATLRSYSLPAAPITALEIDLAPLGAATVRPARGLGVTAGYATAFALDSRVDGTNVGTSWSRIFVGPRFRAAVDEARAIEVGGAVTYDAESMTLASTGAAAALPDVDYRAIHASLEGRLTLGRVRLRATGGYSDVLSAGSVADRMRASSVAGVDASLGAALKLVAGFEVRASASYRRFFYSFQPLPGDAYVAGGAVDQLGTFEGGLAWTR